MNTHQLKINPEFQSLIPPLSTEEFRQLEQNITQHKCRDAIITWNNTIIDGHNRYEICHRHSIPFKVSPISFPSRKEAILWIINHQLGRRNLPDAQRIQLAIRKAELTKKGLKGARKIIAKEAGVSETKVQKFMKIQEYGDKNLLSKVNTGELKIGTAHNMIKITTTEIEPIFSQSQLDEFNSKYHLTAALNNIATIKKLYQSLLITFPLKDEESTLRLQKRLNSQLKALRNLLLCCQSRKT